MSVSDEIRALRLTKGIPARDMVEVAKRHYPKFDKTMLSKLEHGEDYGAQMPHDLLNALYAEFAPELLAAQKRTRDGKHRLTCRVSARLETEDYEALQRQMSADGYPTNQDLLTALVRRYISGGDGHV